VHPVLEITDHEMPGACRLSSEHEGPRYCWRTSTSITVPRPTARAVAEQLLIQIADLRPPHLGLFRDRRFWSDAPDVKSGGMGTDSDDIRCCERIEEEGGSGTAILAGAAAAARMVAQVREQDLPLIGPNGLLKLPMKKVFETTPDEVTPDQARRSFS
jgi:hypothetical protein